MPGVVTIGHSTLSNNLITLDALGCELVLVAFSAINVMLLWDERLCANRIVTGAANKTLFVPLPCLVLHLLHACSENVAAAITPGCKLGVITGSAINSIGFRAKLLVDQRRPAFGADKASFVPVLLFVRQILGVDPNDFAALIAVVGEHVLVALDAVRVVVP